MQKKQMFAVNVVRALVCLRLVNGMKSSVGSCLLVHVGALTPQWKHFSPMHGVRYTKFQKNTKLRQQGQ